MLTRKQAEKINDLISERMVKSVIEKAAKNPEKHGISNIVRNNSTGLVSSFEGDSPTLIIGSGIGGTDKKPVIHIFFDKGDSVPEEGRSQIENIIREVAGKFHPEDVEYINLHRGEKPKQGRGK